VLLFYMAILPQFLEPDAGVAALLLLAFSHAALSLGYLLALVAGMDRARRVLIRRPVRRGLDCVTGCALLGFGVRMALQRD
jgi:threonine/homoserine/homoserine lactone efflux protein